MQNNSKPPPIETQPYTAPSGVVDAANLKTGHAADIVQEKAGKAGNYVKDKVGLGDKPEQKNLEDFSSHKELTALKSEIEKGTQQALFTRVTSWVFEEGQQPGPDTINFRLWKRDPVQAEKDLKIIYKQFPDFEALIKSKQITDQPTLARFLATIFEERDQVRDKNKEALKGMSKEIGKDWIGEFFEGGGRKISEWSEQGAAGYAKIGLAGLATFYVASKIFKLGKGIFDRATSGDNHWLMQTLVVGGLSFGAYKLLGAVTPAEAAEPEGGGHDLSWSKREEEISGDVDKNEWQKLIKSNDGVQTFLGMTNAPVEAILEAYQTGHTEHAINPKFLLAHVQGKGVMRDRQRDMIKKIDPTRLYEVIHATIQMFENDPGRKSEENKNKTMLEYIQQEYVVKAKERGTTIEYPELLADAARIAVPRGAAAVPEVEKPKGEQGKNKNNTQPAEQKSPSAIRGGVMPS